MSLSGARDGPASLPANRSHVARPAVAWTPQTQRNLMILSCARPLPAVWTPRARRVRIPISGASPSGSKRPKVVRCGSKRLKRAASALANIMREPRLGDIRVTKRSTCCETPCTPPSTRHTTRRSSGNFLLRVYHIRLAPMKGADFFYRRTGTIWQNANAQS